MCFLSSPQPSATKRHYFVGCILFVLAVVVVQYNKISYFDTNLTILQAETDAHVSSVVNPPQPSTKSIPWLQCEGGRERRRLAFPKNHKVAGSTVKTILSRYAYTKKLNVIIPRPFRPSRLYPHTLYPEYYMPPPPNQTFDMLMYHTVYNRTRFREILPNDTAYVTIIRKPLDHLRSAWNFYNYGKMFKISPKIGNPIATFLADPARYDRRCGHDRDVHLPVCLTKNSISVDLGFPVNYNKKVSLGSDPEERKKLTNKFVRKIDHDFDLVMLTEYFDESLVLLKRLMCWTLQDIIYIRSVNVKNRNRKEIHLPAELLRKHKEWSYLDYALYDHFNRSFWRRINSTGNDFWGEVNYFRHLNDKALRHCRKPCSFDQPPLVVNKTRWSPGFMVDNDLCLLLRRDVFCHISIQAERVGRSLWLTAQNASAYGFHKRKKGKTSSKTVLKAVRPYCVYCKPYTCGHLDYLSHFYRDGYVSEEVYRATRKLLCSNRTGSRKSKTKGVNST